MGRTVLALFLGLLVGACGDGGQEDNAIDSDGSDGSDTTSTDERTKGCEKMDILFVVDDSASMLCEQQMLGAAFPGFIETIESYNNANTDEISYRVAVTSTGRSFNYVIGAPSEDNPWRLAKGRDGVLEAAGGAEHPWLDGPSGDAAALSAAFAQAAELGTQGPPLEMPLEALRLAVLGDAAGEPNEGFLRPDALFIAVIITDEDDCSRSDDWFVLPENEGTDPTDECAAWPELVDLAEYEQFLRDRFGRSRFVVAVAAGKDGCDADAYPTTCTEDSSHYAGATAANRLYAFVADHVGLDDYSFGVFSDLCTHDIPSALGQALEKIEYACSEFGEAI